MTDNDHTMRDAGTATSDTTALRAISAVFFLESAVLGNWVPRIPDIKQALSLSDSVLGLCLLAVPLGTVLGLLVAGRIIERVGLRTACQVFLCAWAMLFVLVPMAASAVQLGAVLTACGFVLGLTEVAMNTEADRIEARIGRRIMSRCHGFWSLGSMVGALAGAGLAQLGLDVLTHFALVMPAIALAGAWAGYLLPRASSRGREAPDAAARTDGAALFQLPPRGLLLLCAMPLGAMAVEGAYIDWSAVFMRDVLAASPLTIGVTYAAFSVVMAGTRFTGDRIAARYGDVAVVRWSGVAATLGIALFALAPNVPAAFAAAAVSGMGVAIVYPLTVSAAARRPGRSAADNVAALTMVSFCAFLVAPPLIGFLSDWLGLRWALLALAPVAAVTVVLAPEVARGGSARSSASGDGLPGSAGSV